MRRMNRSRVGLPGVSFEQLENGELQFDEESFELNATRTHTLSVLQVQRLCGIHSDRGRGEDRRPGAKLESIDGLLKMLDEESKLRDVPR